MTSKEADHPERQPAIPESVTRLSTQTTELIAAFGEASEFPGVEENPAASVLYFSERAVREAGFEGKVYLFLTDSPPYELDGTMTQHQVDFWIERLDDQIRSERLVGLVYAQEGYLSVTTYDNIFPINTERRIATDDELDAFRRAMMEEDEHNSFNQAECNQLFKLVKLETKLRQQEQAAAQTAIAASQSLIDEEGNIDPAQLTEEQQKHYVPEAERPPHEPLPADKREFERHYLAFAQLFADDDSHRSPGDQEVLARFSNLFPALATYLKEAEAAYIEQCLYDQLAYTMGVRDEFSPTRRRVYHLDALYLAAHLMNQLVRRDDFSK